MKPIIGITSNVEHLTHTLQNTYIQAVIAGGGVPLIIPTGVETDVGQITSIIDGLVVSGGGDINPMEFNEEPIQQLGDVTPERDSIELELVRQMLSLDKPILGICRGHQILNVAFGGTIYQDINTQITTPLVQHNQNAKRSHQSHTVNVVKDTLLASITLSEKILVNSFHHQAVKDIPSPLIVSGQASDGVVEAMESTKHHFVLGVQWHPEALLHKGDQVSDRLFKAYINACLERMVQVEDN
ncbi:gamma-glutamyl-gamma-aminobutyrate hydrolase family protein [Sporosarcina thermotolerans]|uniref:Gamma-glutamyl-gamma-aminobutyrate hydrolase family protein n=1 Tax=Sporosarcina thermotolerans TaxID=633404 RepID=A0AAW9A646_9BACL|nr:gamma-glutamyl-gamma-aminobutyrate hydrolase family protein [Sporosarcina thermotolerans]MDW0116702.1 gamma-glutamyl-gamma-aminobutyrate hydrolase family protein [Sporosarcina thermotolerans]WHT48895.1 gamma-glutamyl-gamma-aminobutyrate hydrolase family protein [Sporosarcina thermotolerans]